MTTPRFSPAALDGQIRERIETLAHAARRVRETGDEEAIHDLRVAARRLDAMLGLWRHMLSERPRRRAQRSLGRLRRRLGTAREHEVHAAMLAERIERLPATTRIAASSMQERLIERRDRARARATRRAQPQRIDKLLGRVHSACRDLHQRSAVPIDALRTAVTRCTEREHKGRAAIARALATSEDEALHRARIAVKKWRYALEGLQFVRGVPEGEGDADRQSSNRLVLLRRLQRSLGDVQDLVTLLAVVRRDHDRLLHHGFGEAAEALDALLVALEAEREGAVARFRALAGELPPVAPRARPGGWIAKSPRPSGDAESSSSGH